ncbi:efflux RND transporter permease subunit, partial [Luteitalea sp.]
MSIPRTAIERPVTMFMISAVIVLLGAISLVQLPVDLLPDLTFPSLTVRVGYPGVGPREIEETITRPIEQTVSAVAGLDQLSSTSSEGSSTVRLNFV